MKITKATKNDIKKIATVEKECFSTEAWSENAIKEAFENDISAFFIAYFENEIIGYIGIYSILDEGYIYNLAISKNHRRKGVAEQLIKTLIEYGKEKNLKFISLEVRESNAPAINLYKKCGFELNGIRKNFYKNPKENGLIFTMNNEQLKIPVEISARHVHLDKKIADLLFGKDYKFTIKRELSQRGQYLYEEKVTLKNAKFIIKNVSIIGPLRNKTQVEISLTDARKLKISAPIRESGDIKNSASCIVAGSNGEIEISEGVIISKRHLHIPESMKEKFNVKNGKTVKIRIKSQDRSLIFDDVIARIHPKFELALHIDTDEGNAANCEKEIFGEIVTGSL